MKTRYQRPHEPLRQHTRHGRISEFENSPCTLSRPNSAEWLLHPNRQFAAINPIYRLVGRSPLMTALRRQVTRFADTAETVLICGETGTGKDLIARLLHELSPRRNRPFVPLNCAAIPESLAESELFGSARGAFTGAVQCRNGLFLEANDGTLFLDEFGELSPRIQVKLLRAIELGAFRPVGASQERQINVRIIAATNRDLRASVARKEFRADLYHRISVLQIIAPPLRHHPDDIPELVGMILSRLLPVESEIRVAHSAMSQLIRNPWTGNVRELINVLRRAVILSENSLIDTLDYSLGYTLSSFEIDDRRLLSPSRLIDSLIRNRGVLAAVAQDLGISVRTVQRRIKALGLRLDNFRLYHNHDAVLTTGEVQGESNHTEGAT